MKKPYIAAASEILADKFGVSRMAVVDSVIPLTLDSVQKFQSGAVWLRYRV